MTSLSKLTLRNNEISSIQDHLNTNVLPLKRIKIDMSRDSDKLGYQDSSSDSDDDEGSKITLSQLLDIEFTKAAKSTIIKGVRKLTIDIRFDQPEDGEDYFKPEQAIEAELEDEMRYAGLSNGSQVESSQSISVSRNEGSLSQNAIPDFIKEQIANDYLCLNRCEHSIVMHDIRYNGDLVIEFKECSERYN